MKYYHSYIIAFFFICLSLSLNAQTKGKSKTLAAPNIEVELQRTDHTVSSKAATVLPVHRANVYMEATKEVDLSPENLKGTNPQTLLANQPMNCKLILSVFNTGTIAKIHVKLGSAEGKTNFVSQVFNFDQNAPAPFSYARDGKTIVLGLGQYTNMGPCYGEVILEDLNGKRSAPKRFGTKG